MGVVHPVFAHAPSVAGLGHVHASDSPPGGLVGQSLVPQITAGEHEQRAKYDSGRPARPIVKTHDVDDPGDDQGKPPEEGPSAEEPHDQTANDITGLSLPFGGFSSCSVKSSDHRQTEMLA
jgi:hypothetical protein